MMMRIQTTKFSRHLGQLSSLVALSSFFLRCFSSKLLQSPNPMELNPLLEFYLAYKKQATTKQLTKSRDYIELKIFIINNQRIKNKCFQTILYNPSGKKFPSNSAKNLLSPIGKCTNQHKQYLNGKTEYRIHREFVSLRRCIFSM